jgi:hypothetical protein
MPSFLNPSRPANVIRMKKTIAGIGLRIDEAEMFWITTDLQS